MGIRDLLKPRERAGLHKDIARRIERFRVASGPGGTFIVTAKSDGAIPLNSRRAATVGEGSDTAAANELLRRADGFSRATAGLRDLLAVMRPIVNAKSAPTPKDGMAMAHAITAAEKLLLEIEL